MIKEHLYLDENTIESGLEFEKSAIIYEEDKRISHEISMELLPKVIEIYGYNPFKLVKQKEMQKAC